MRIDPRARPHRPLLPTLLLIGASGLLPDLAAACACGCGVFDVGTGAMFPEGAGGVLYAEFDSMNQNTNWAGGARSPAAEDPDKDIRTDFYTVGARYMFDRAWGVQVDVPYWQRSFTTAEDAGTVATFRHGALADIRIRGLYTGFSGDLSTGVSFGLKLPTGDATYAHFDPDTEIGTGSTDLLLGAYHLGKIPALGGLNYFVNALWQEPLKTRGDYRPGAESVAVAGIYRQGWSVGAARVTPVLQATADYRAHDGGALGDPANTGYRRLIAAPGLEVDFSRVHLYAEAGFSLYDEVTGNQLISRRLYKVVLSYAF